MNKKVTIRDIAEKTGTSVTSVHRALYDSDGISETLKKKILREVRRSNYRMDEAASILRRAELNITVLLPKPKDKERFYYRGLWEGIYEGMEEIRRNKVQISLIQIPEGVSHICDALEKLYDDTDESLHGLVTICDDEESKDWIQRFIRRGTQVVLVDKGVEIENLCSSVETSSGDMAKLAMALMDMLIGDWSDGHLLFVNGPEHRESYKTYGKTVRQWVKDHVPEQEIIQIDGYQEETGRHLIRTLFKEEKIRGIICSCARGTYWVCNEISKMKLSMPPPVVGTDVFVEIQPFFENGILKASIYQSHREHGKKALRCLYECLTNPYAKRDMKQLGALSVVLKENYSYFM